MTLENFVKLESDVEKRLKIREGSFRIEPRIILDPRTKSPKSINVAVMDVIEEDGKPVTKGFSTVSDKLATQLRAAHDNGTLYRYTVGIKRVGSGYATEYQLRLF
jgi:hypothetical protein